MKNVVGHALRELCVKKFKPKKAGVVVAANGDQLDLSGSPVIAKRKGKKKREKQATLKWPSIPAKGEDRSISP